LQGARPINELLPEGSEVAMIAKDLAYGATGKVRVVLKLQT
jgi:hypothetical protein